MNEFFNHVVYQNFMSSRFENLLLLKNGSIFTEQALAVVGVDSFINFHQKFHSDTCLAQETGPYIVCTGCATLTQLETFAYNQEQVEYLNNTGLSIYLFEDLYISHGAKIKNNLQPPPQLGDTTDYYNRYGNSIRGFESTPENLKTIHSYELESIKVFIDNNKLTNVTVYCGDYNAATYLQSAYPMMRIATRNLYVIRAAKGILDKPSVNIGPKTSNLITHRFLSANGKYKAVRHLVAAYLLDRSSILAFNQKTSVWGSLQKQLWFNIASWNKTNPKMFTRLMSSIQKLETLPTTTIGFDTNIPNPNFDLAFDYAPQSEYQQCFCAVVAETKYSHPVATFSEKTLNAIARHRPFILVAPPHTLEYLQHYGFKTFDNFWDESYDREENHEKRLIKIFKLIDYIDNLPITTLRNLYQTMIPTLQHNYEVIKTIPKVWPL